MTSTVADPPISTDSRDSTTRDRSSSIRQRGKSSNHRRTRRHDSSEEGRRPSRRRHSDKYDSSPDDNCRSRRRRHSSSGERPKKHDDRHNKRSRRKSSSEEKVISEQEVKNPEELKTTFGQKPVKIEDPLKKGKRRTGWDDPPPAPFVVPPVPAAMDMPITGFSSLSTPDSYHGGTVDNQASSIAVTTQYKPSFIQLCRIYVGSLDYSLSDQDVRQVFSAFGTITNIDMPKEGTRSKGFCFIEYSTPEAADLAIATMPGFNLKGRAIKVGRPTALGGQSGTLPLITNPTTKTGGVNAAEAGQIAAAMLLGKVDSSLGGSVGLGQQDAQYRIYVGCVPNSFTSDDVKVSSDDALHYQKIFDVFGTILSCQLIPSADRPGTHRGYGFIEYSTYEEAKLAIETMNDFTVAGKVLKVNHATTLKLPEGMSPGGTQAMLTTGGDASPVVLLTDIVTPAEANNDLKEEITQECSKYGTVRSVEIMIDNQQVRIFILFDTSESAGNAVPMLHDRWFGGRKIKATLYDVTAYLARNYWLEV